MKFFKQKEINVWNVLPWLWLIAGAVVMLAYHIGPGKALIDGDMGGEMILSDLLNKEGAFLLSDNWYHATEVHVFFMQIIFRPLLLIWPNNWHVVRVVGTLLIYAINTIGYLLMMREIGIRNRAVWSAGTLLWPLGMWRLFLGLYGGQYLVYDFFAFYILWLIFYIKNRLENIKSPKVIVAGIVLAFLSLAGGVNGVRETMMLFAPICLGIVTLIISQFVGYKGEFGDWKATATEYLEQLKLLAVIAGATLFNLVGYAYNLKILMPRFSFQKNTDLVWKSTFSINDFIASLSDFFGMFGYGGEVELFSIEGICSAAGVLMAVVLIFVTIRLFINRHKLSLNERFLFASYVSGLVFCSIIFGMMEGMNEPRYWMPFMFFAIAMIEIEGDVEEFKVSHMRGIIGILISLCIIITSIGTIRTQINNPHEGKLKNLEISEFLDGIDVKQGYAQFWLANTITEQTSGRVAARPIMYSDTFEQMQWSNRIDYATSYPDGEVFYVIDKKSYPGGDVYGNCFYLYGNPEIRRDDEDWLVMVFDSAQTMEKAYETAISNGDSFYSDEY